VIRRAVWVVLGAVLGILGYRRVTSLARALAAPQSPSVRLEPSRSGWKKVGRAQPGLTEPGLTRPGRTQPRRTEPDSGRRVRARPAPVVWAGRFAATASFLRDARAGMAEYLDRRAGG